MAYRAVSDGARGVDMGRNIFQSENPPAMCQAVAKVVHEGYNDKQAYDYYLELENIKAHPHNKISGQSTHSHSLNCPLVFCL